MTRRNHFFVIAILLLIPSDASAQQDPNFRFDFGSYDGRAFPHTDTFDIWADKPVKSLVLALTDPAPIQLPAPETMFLLDVSAATVHSLTNTSTELSMAVTFDSGSELIGHHVAAQVTFSDLFHDTIATASGTFADGTSFSTRAWVGFVPEPSTFFLAFPALAAVAMRRCHRSR